MTVPNILLVAALSTPLVMLAACISRRLRARICGWLAVAPLPGLPAALARPHQAVPVVFPAPVRMTVALDRPGARRPGSGTRGRVAAADAERQPRRLHGRRSPQL